MPPETPPKCPRCGSDDIAEIFYGLPGEETLNDPGLVVGGCDVGEDEPRWHCRACRCEWGRLDEGPWRRFFEFLNRGGT